jgi:integrase
MGQRGFKARLGKAGSYVPCYPFPEDAVSALAKAVEYRELKEKPRERGIFTLDEIKILFSDESIVTVWEGELKHFVANMLPLTTGMRQGEVIALQIQNVL